jgi:hypothetical protein
MRDARFPVVLFSLCVAVGAISIPACKKKRDEAPARQSLEEVRAQVAQLQKATSDVRARFNALPEDLPGLEAVRSKLLAFEEVMGVENARVEWFAGELNAAFASGNEEQIQKISATIKDSIEGSKRLGKTVLELTHQLLPFESMAAHSRAMAEKGLIFTRVLPTGRKIEAAKDGTEQQLLAFIDDGKRKVDKKTWFALDRVSFSGDGAQLDLKQSTWQLENLAAILNAYPQVNLEIGGQTARAGAVKEMLVVSGVAAPRVVAKEKGGPIAVRVTAK